MKLWIDDVRIPPTKEYIWAKSTNAAIDWLQRFNGMGMFDLVDIDHDAGDFVEDGGDFIKVLDWMEEHGVNIPIHIHSMNPVGAQRMRQICYRNNWEVDW